MRSPGFHLVLVRRNDRLLLEQTRTAPAERGGALIALSHIGVCGTDLQILNGTRPDTARILGHEGIGVIVGAGRGAALGKGDRVVFNPVAELCDGRLLGHNVEGLFQEYISVSARAIAHGLVLPAQNFTLSACGALVEPLGAVVYAHELISRVTHPLRTALVFGAGPVGILAAVFLRTRGVRVFVAHRSPIRLATLARLKLIPENEVFLVSEDLSARVLAEANRCGIDAALICTSRNGASDALRQATQIVRSGGCIDLITNYPEHTPAPLGLSNDALRAVRAANVCGIPKEGAYHQVNLPSGQLTLTGHRGTSADHLKQAMHELRQRGERYVQLITHSLSLSEAAGAIQTLASGERSLAGRDCIKAVIDLTTPSMRSWHPAWPSEPTQFE